jgi:hypothetical protein
MSQSLGPWGPYFGHAYEHRGSEQVQQFGRIEPGSTQAAVDKELAVAVAELQFGFAKRSKHHLVLMLTESG